MKKQTPGRWSFQGPKTNDGFDNQTYFTINSDCGEVRGNGYLIPGFFYPLSSQSPEEMEANASLIAEAGTVANECGITPTELLKQRNELLEVLKMAVKKYEDELTNPFCMDWFKRAKSIIK